MCADPQCCAAGRGLDDRGPRGSGRTASATAHQRSAPPPLEPTIEESTDRHSQAQEWTLDTTDDTRNSMAHCAAHTTGTAPPVKLRSASAQRTEELNHGTQCRQRKLGQHTPHRHGGDKDTMTAEHSAPRQKHAAEANRQRSSRMQTCLPFADWSTDRATSCESQHATTEWRKAQRSAL